MNRQINYIVSASLIILAGFCTYSLVNKIPSRISVDEPVSVCGNSGTSSSSLCEQAIKGKALFMSKCASCHAVNKDLIGPELMRFTENEPWTVRQNVYDWIHHPALFIKKNEYTRNLKKSFGGTMMTAFPGMTNEEIDDICLFLTEGSRFETLPVASN